MDWKKKIRARNANQRTETKQQLLEKNHERERKDARTAPKEDEFRFLSARTRDNLFVIRTERKNYLIWAVESTNF